MLVVVRATTCKSGQGVSARVICRTVVKELQLIASGVPEAIEGGEDIRNGFHVVCTELYCLNLPLWKVWPYRAAWDVRNVGGRVLLFMNTSS